jgi:hypothetical protein
MRVALLSAFSAFLVFPFAAAHSGPEAPGNYTACPKFAPGPVTASFIAESFTNRVDVDVANIEAIRQVTALYALAIDGRSFETLRKVFVPDARANYSDPIGVLNGVQAVIDTLGPSLQMFVTTQHHLGTQYIHVCDADNAVSVTYFQASHFFTPYTGVQNPVGNDKVLVDRAQYQDVWARQKDGTWKITNRNLVRMVRDAISVFPCHAILVNVLILNYAGSSNARWWVSHRTTVAMQRLEMSWDSATLYNPC